MSSSHTPAFDAESPDALILDAFEKVRRDRAAYYAASTDAQYEAAGLGDDALVALEAIVSDTQAQTIEGVIAQLSLTMPGADTSRWIDETLVRWGLPGLIAVSDVCKERGSWPAYGIATAAASLVRIAWSQAVARYERDNEIFCYLISGEDLVTNEGIDNDPLRKYFDTALAQYSDDEAVRSLIKTLAPDVEALRVKAQIAIREGMGDEALPWLARDTEYVAAAMLAIRDHQDREASDAPAAQ